MKLPSVFNNHLDLINDWNDFLSPLGISSSWVEDKEKYSIQYDLPGLDKQDIKISCVRQVLKVRATGKLKPVMVQCENNIIIKLIYPKG